ncbi:MAG: phosphoribosylformylglycinamidine cyclo-ligase [Pseudomonadota bacterium]
MADPQDRASPDGAAPEAGGPDRASLTYADAGVSIEAGARLVDQIGPAAARTRRPGVVGALGGFGALFDLQAAGYASPLLVAATDGVGTKLKAGIESGMLSGLGVDLVAMCVNDLICQGAEPLFFLDYFATGTLDPDHAAAVVSGVADGCAAAGCALIGGETAEMPGLYRPGEFDLAGFAVGAVERDRVLPQPCDPGDVILGLASSGAHSNGYSLIRKIVERSGLGWDAAAPFETNRSLGEALLEPTRLYVRSVLSALGAFAPDAASGRGPIRGIAHITGGGLTENLPRIFGEALKAEVALSSWERPALFRWLAEESAAGDREMLKTFNCGVGLCIVVEREAAGPIAAALRQAGETVYEIGGLAAREAEEDRIVYEGRL